MSEQECNESCRVQECTILCGDSNAALSCFTTLPTEMLYKIFKLCHLRDQLMLAKVCRWFREIVRTINERRFKCFHYSYLTLKYAMNLQNNEISELCCLYGSALEQLYFSTFFNAHMLDTVEYSAYISPVGSLMNFMNDNFRQNIKYFRNIKELNVQGKFLQDETILELAKQCKKLKTLRLLDGDNRWLRGNYLQELEAIENLELKSCRKLDPDHLLALSQKRQLKSLNIVECKLLKDIPKIIEACDHWQFLETLRLTAFSQDSELIKAITSLPALKTLQFFWINFMPVDFEETLFRTLSSNPVKCMQLKHIKFENDRYNLEDISIIPSTPESYAIMREEVCINGQLWQWPSDLFTKISTSFENFKNLLTLTFAYCRLLDYEQLKHICLTNKKLELIKISGCPKREDEQLQRQWLAEEFSSKCQLTFDSILSLETVTDLYIQANLRQYSPFYHRDPVFRSIECLFD